MISVVHATRGRPEKALATRADYFRKALGGVEYMFVVDVDDEKTLRALREADAAFLVKEPRGGPDAYNAGARGATSSVIVVAADDVVPPAEWDLEIMRRLGSDGALPRVLAVSDGHRTDLLQPHPILTRARFEQQGGVIFAPDYCTGRGAIFADADFTESAYRDGVVVEARELVFRHAHPSFGEAEWDDIYRRGNSPREYREGLAIFKRRHPAPQFVRVS